MNNNEVNRLIDIVKKLRAPDGCPWDREQTHQSVRGHLVEECAELLEAIDLQDSDKMREEIGDVLMNLLLHAEIESENGNFNFNDVAKELGDKLVRRHPHVFGEEKVNDSDDVLKIWQDVKKKEKKNVPSADFSQGFHRNFLHFAMRIQSQKKPTLKRSLTPRKIHKD